MWRKYPSVAAPCIWRSFTATFLGSCIRSDYQTDMVLKKICRLERLTSFYIVYVYGRYLNWQCHKNTWSTETVKFKILSTVLKTIQTQNGVKILTYLLYLLYLLTLLTYFTYLLYLLNLLTLLTLLIYFTYLTHLTYLTYLIYFTYLLYLLNLLNLRYLFTLLT